jgi:hypothetical protein
MKTASICAAAASVPASNIAAGEVIFPDAPDGLFVGKFLGDWRGLRSDRAVRGFTFEFAVTNVPQRIPLSDGFPDFEFGGRLDAFFNVDSAKLGVRQGRRPAHSHWMPPRPAAFKFRG